MKRFLLILLALGLAGGAALLALGLAIGLPDGHDLHVVINDRELDLGAHHAASVVAAAIGIFVAACVIGLVVPLALLLGVLLPVLLLAALTLGGAALLGAGALALAPLWLPLLFVVWLWRRSRRARPPTAGGSGGATIDA